MQVCASCLLLYCIKAPGTNDFRARRVKCDEREPLCGRCIQAGRLCGGYNHDARSPSSSLLHPALKFGVASDRQTERLSYLAAYVLSLDRNGLLLQEHSIWGRPFLQLSNTVNCVKAAAAAFGAAYESHLLGKTRGRRLSIWYFYGSALRLLQSDLNGKVVSSEPLAITSLILACVEILGQHEQNALAHLLGAARILDTNCRGRSTRYPGILGIIEQELFNVDILVANYNMSQPPVRMCHESHGLSTAGDAFSKPETALRASILSLHSAYGFIARAAPLRYKSPSWIEHDSSMSLYRTTTLASLRAILDGLVRLTVKLRAKKNAAAASSGAQTLAEIYALICQVTSALIFILSIHSPYETIYDEHQHLFQSIISNAAASARLKRSSKPSVFNRFSARLGIIGPLSLVSMKARDPRLRTLAISMLNELGREGPADGPTMAAIGARLAAIEESASRSELGPQLTASDIHEEQRVHGIALKSPPVSEVGRRFLHVEFSMPNPPLLEGWTKADYSNQSSWRYLSDTIST